MAETILYLLIAVYLTAIIVHGLVRGFVQPVALEIRPMHVKYIKSPKQPVLKSSVKVFFVDEVHDIQDIKFGQQAPLIGERYARHFAQEELTGYLKKFIDCRIESDPHVLVEFGFPAYGKLAIAEISIIVDRKK